MSAHLVVLLSVLASATATLTLNLLARLDWRQGRLGSRRGPGGAPAAPRAPAGCRQRLVVARCGPVAIAVLHEQGYLPFGQLGGGGELLANGEAAAAVWPAPPNRIAAVQFGTLSLGPAHQQPTSHLDAAALAAASRTHRAIPTADPAAPAEVFELVYPLLDPPPAQHAARDPVVEQTLAHKTGPTVERPAQEW